MDCDHKGRTVDDVGDRSEALVRIVWQRFETKAINDHRIAGACIQRRSVGGSTRGKVGPENRCSAWPVLKDELLTERTAEPVGDDSQDKIGRAAGTVRDYDFDRIIRIILSIYTCAASKTEDADPKEPMHGVLC